MKKKTCKICPYVQNRTSITEKYTYTEDGRVEEFNQSETRVNAICVEEKCTAWRKGKCYYNV